jgi:hypothetical protein
MAMVTDEVLAPLDDVAKSAGIRVVDTGSRCSDPLSDLLPLFSKWKHLETETKKLEDHWRVSVREMITANLVNSNLLEDLLRNLLYGPFGIKPTFVAECAQMSLYALQEKIYIFVLCRKCGKEFRVLPGELADIRAGRSHNYPDSTMEALLALAPPFSSRVYLEACGFPYGRKEKEQGRCGRCITKQQVESEAESEAEREVATLEQLEQRGIPREVPPLEVVHQDCVYPTPEVRARVKSIREARSALSSQDNDEDQVTVEIENLDEWVYFIRRGADGPIKIGISKSVEDRIAALQTASAEGLVLLGRCRGTKLVERSLHDQFKHLRRVGEWFHPAAELLEFISKVTADDKSDDLMLSISQQRANINLEQIWFDEMRLKYKDLTLPSRWQIKELAQVRKLLVLYKAELVGQAMRYLIAAWDDIRDRYLKGKSGYPSVGFLLACHGSLFLEAQEKSAHGG